MVRGRSGRDGPNPIDVHVGRRMRLRRTLLGMTQGMLGEGIGLTFQQVQKYERGSTRVGASRLFDLARVLDVPVSFFFDDMSEDLAVRLPGQSKDEAEDVGPNPMAERETLELVRAYYKIQDASVRKHIVKLVRSLAVDHEGKT